MIYRSRFLVAQPAVLASVGSPAAIERAKAIAYYTGATPPKGNMPFTVYRRQEIKDTLNTLFASKCAYCESIYIATQPMEVEHYRPKGEVRTAAGVTLPIGYWWRASTWENLLPSCTDCNRERWHKVGRKNFKYGKHSKFPLASAHHATNEAGIAVEDPLLIDPSAEDPSAHMGFRFGQSQDAIAYAKMISDTAEDPKGRTSVDVYGLNRPGLVKTRASHLRYFQFALRGIEKDRLRAEEIKADQTRYQAQLTELKREIREVIALYLHWKSPYVAMCRSYFDLWKKGLEDRLAQEEAAGADESDNVLA